MAKIINLEGEIGWEITPQLVRNLLPKTGEDVIIKVNSPGGYIYMGFSIYNLIKAYPGKTTAVVSGIAASAASYIILAADNVHVYENSTIMIHKAWNLTIGNSDDLKKEAAKLDGIDMIMAKEYAKKTGQEVNEVLKEMSEEKWMEGSDQIIENSFADDVVIPGKEETPIVKISKSEALARIEQVRNRCEEDIETKHKAAACIKDWTFPDEPDKIENNLEDENSMKLEDYLKANPEAAAEIKTSQEAAIKTAVKAAVDSERARTTEILNLAGVTLSDVASGAIENGSDSGEFAKAELIAAKKTGVGADNSDKLGGVTASTQVPGDSAVEEDKTTEEAAAIARQDAVFAKKYKKNGGAK